MIAQTVYLITERGVQVSAPAHSLFWFAMMLVTVLAVAILAVKWRFGK